MKPDQLTLELDSKVLSLLQESRSNPNHPLNHSDLQYKMEIRGDKQVLIIDEDQHGEPKYLKC